MALCGVDGAVPLRWHFVGSRGGGPFGRRPISPQRFHNPAGIVEIRSVRVGVVAIRAVHTGFYLAMNKQGQLYTVVLL